MIDVFYGEFLINVTPLEMSGNTCSHNCCYCFANIEWGTRVSEIAREIAFLKGESRANNLATALYNRGYPICFSNRTDPFSESNIQDTRVLSKILRQKENGLFIQTKCGKEEYIDEFLEDMHGKKNIVFYITVTTPRDDISRIIEPGAPLPSKRKEIAKKIKKAGYPVIIAFNPFVEGWTDLEENARECAEYKAAGIDHFIYQCLKLNSQKVSSFSKERAARFKRSGCDTGLYIKKTTGLERQRYAQKALINSYNAGNKALMFGMPFRTDFFNMLEKTYQGKIFPSNYFFYNWVIKNKKKGDVVTKEEYIAALSPYLGDLIDMPFGEMDAYVLRVARNVWKGNMKIQRIKTYRELLGAIYDEKRITHSPRNNWIMSASERGELIYNGIIKPEQERR
jgi:DNA repair photolyase